MEIKELFRNWLYFKLMKWFNADQEKEEIKSKIYNKQVIAAI